MALIDIIDRYLETKFPGKETSAYKDLSLNLKKVLDDSSPLEVKERLVVLAALSRSVNLKDLEILTANYMQESHFTQAEIEECFEAAAIMGMLNTYYKFKSYLPTNVSQDVAYQRVGLRMNTLMKPLVGKEKYEMMALAVSVVNGCSTCVVSHEKTLTDIGVQRDKIHELARMAAILKGLSQL